MSKLLSTEELETKCKDHVLSLRPSIEEVVAIREFNVEWLAVEASWPPPLMNYVFRYMHSHNMYQIPKSKYEILQNLTTFIGYQSRLPMTEDVKIRLSEKCTALIIASSRRWKDEKLLVSRGPSFGKHAILRQIWDFCLPDFHRAEAEVYGFRELAEDPIEENAIAKIPHNSQKRALDSDNADEATKKSRKDSPSSQGVHNGDVMQVPIEDSDASSQWNNNASRNPHGGECIVTAVTETRPEPEESHSDQECQVHIRNGACRWDPSVENTNELSSTSHTFHRLDDRSAPDHTEVYPSGPTTSPRSLHEIQDQVEEPGVMSASHPVSSPVTNSQTGPPEVMSRGLQILNQQLLSQYESRAAVERAVERAVGRQSRMPSAVNLQTGTSFSEKFRAIGTLLIPQIGWLGPWSLNVSTLMEASSEAAFFASYYRITGKRVSQLKIELLDTLEHNRVHYISSGDSISFEHLRRDAWCGFLEVAKADPYLEGFRLLIEIPVAGSGNRGNAAWSSSAPEKINFVSSKAQPARKRNPARSTPPSVHHRTLPPRIGHQADHSPHHTLEIVDEGERVGSGDIYGQINTSKRSVAQPSPNRARLSGNGIDVASSYTQIVIRIQQNERGTFSHRYQKAVLAPGMTGADFFAWFAKETGCGNPLGPSQLAFCFKDALPPKTNVIARGNEEHFEYMKRDIRPLFDRTRACMPELLEFVILVTIPGWTERIEEEDW